MTITRTELSAYLIALSLVTGTGLVHGLWTHRWADSHDVEAAAARLERVPLNVGDWSCEVLEVGQAALARAEVAGYLSRRYTNRRTGQSVDVMLLCGRFGPLAVHTPDVCFGGAGFQMMEPAARMDVQPAGGDAGAQVWTARFQKTTGPAAQYIRAAWSWSDGSGWQAPEYPRLAFRSAPVLFKLYVIREMARPDEPLDADPGLALLRCLLPEMDAALAEDARVSTR